MRNAVPAAGWRLAALLLLMSATVADAGVEVVVRGIEGEVKDNVEARLSIETLGERRPENETLVRRLHARAPQEIERALQPFGYYSPEIEAELSGSPPDWRAVYTVSLGPRTQVDEVEVQVQGEGAGEPALQRAVQDLKALAGEPLRHQRYERRKASLSSAAYGLGYLDVRYVESELRVNRETQQADIDLRLDTGPRYYFGELRFDVDELDESFLRRYVTIREGEPYDPQELLDSQFALVDLGYFESVELEPQREQADPATPRRVPIRVRTELRPGARYDFGIGYGTDTGARLSAAAERRHINRRGHQLRGDLRLSEQKNAVIAEYRIPMGDRAAEQLSFAAAYTSERLEDGDSLKYGIGATLTRRPGDWQRDIYLKFEHEESELGLSRQTADLLIPGISFSRRDLDDPIHAREGWSLFTDLHGSHTALLANTSFVQMRITARGVLPVGDRGRLLGRAEVGGTLVDEFGELPASQRFFAGGDQSVRGYRYQSLGPVDASGQVVGGKFLNAYSIEYEHFVWRNWGAAVFFDIGGAANDPGANLHRGVGVGLRYRAPIGYVNVDLAHPLDGDEEGVRLHLSLRVGL